MVSSKLTRRDFSSLAGASALSAASACVASSAEPFSFRFLLGSCLFGYEPLKNILREIKNTHSIAIDIWPRVHGDQREQLDTIGEAAFHELLENHDTRLGCITQYKLGPFGLQEEMQLASRFDCPTIVTGGAGPKNLTGGELKQAVQTFVDKLQPHLEVAAETGVTIAIENHGNNLIESPDSLKWLAEMTTDLPLGIALAPYHLPQDAIAIAELIETLGPKLSLFYAWQHGAGCMKKMPKEQELLQLPGRGDLDFAPIVAALEKINFAGWTEIFMHPFPRGVPILETTAQVTAAINQARQYLESLR